MEDRMGECIGLLLAAGASKRFGSDKRHARLPHGETVLEQSARRLMGAVDHTVVVLRADDSWQERWQKMWQEGSDGLVPCYAEESVNGMGCSLAAGAKEIAKLRETPDEKGRKRNLKGLLVMLADMPYIAEETISSVVERGLSERDTIVVPTYEGIWGHPIYFDLCWLSSLLVLSGDQGARSILKHNTTAVRELPLSDPMILYDIDLVSDILPAKGGLSEVREQRELSERRELEPL